ncbi:Oxoglutarate/iron-dependent dioxygenase [Trypanosoma melophagium]|uniref:Oxoglutarate/iron-dependent dioxygenase n=1 Tax=Trypanosoma melophagium TaxID=715481 RepID=UPI00351A6C75|nr:Oxoglutarate/iron-dependent dioxygenase [Trypanosoma melophagium]
MAEIYLYVSAAFRALDEHALFDRLSPLFHVSRRQNNNSSASPTKVELSARLHRLCNIKEKELSGRGVIPPPILHICHGLETAAMQFAQQALLHPHISRMARAEFLNNIRRRSVFRIWRYHRGVGCRPHYDPGLCTALLLPSPTSGLEVNLQQSLPSVPGRPGNYRYDEAEQKNKVDSLPGWTAPTSPKEEDDTLVLSGDMMRVLSNNALPAVLHRVRDDWATGSETVRYSFVLELRPAEPQRWYKLAQQQQKEKEEEEEGCLTKE